MTLLGPQVMIGARPLLLYDLFRTSMLLGAWRNPIYKSMDDQPVRQESIGGKAGRGRDRLEKLKMPRTDHDHLSVH